MRYEARPCQQRAKTNSRGIPISRDIFLLLASLICVFALASCVKADPSSLTYLDSKVLISGIEPEDFSVTVEELTRLDSVSKKAEAVRSNGEKVKLTAVGPTLDTFLEKYRKNKTDYTSIRFTSTDGYSIAVPREILEKREIVLAYMDGKKAFDKDTAPLRVVVLGERAMYWARMVSKIEFETDTDGSMTNKVVLLDTVLPQLKGKYSKEEGGDIVSTIDLLTKYGGLSDRAKVYLSAYDGLKKNETQENFLKGYIKYTGENIPQFCSPELPEGMNMNGIVSIRTGRTLYISMDQGAKLWPAKNVQTTSGVGFSDMVKDSGFNRSDNYVIITATSESLVLSEKELSVAVFAVDGKLWNIIGEDGKKLATNVATIEPQK